MQQREAKTRERAATAVRKVDVDAETAGQRVDNFLRKELPGVPKSRVYRLLRRGEGLGAGWGGLPGGWFFGGERVSGSNAGAPGQQHAQEQVQEMKRKIK